MSNLVYSPHFFHTQVALLAIIITLTESVHRAHLAKKCTERGGKISKGPLKENEK